MAEKAAVARSGGLRSTSELGRPPLQAAQGRTDPAGVRGSRGGRSIRRPIRLGPTPVIASEQVLVGGCKELF